MGECECAMSTITYTTSRSTGDISIVFDLVITTSLYLQTLWCWKLLFPVVPPVLFDGEGLSGQHREEHPSDRVSDLTHTLTNGMSGLNTNKAQNNTRRTADRMQEGFDAKAQVAYLHPHGHEPCVHWTLEWSRIQARRGLYMASPSSCQ